MWGIVPAAGMGSRIQPLAFSKELLPLLPDSLNAQPPRAVSEYLLERMILAGVDRICFVISPGKADIIRYFGSRYRSADLCYVVQEEPAGLCDAIFRARHLVGQGEHAVIGLPDTVWFPKAALNTLPNDPLSFLLFPVGEPQHFDVVLTDASGKVREISVKPSLPESHWVWGAIKLRGDVLNELYELWTARGREDAYLGTLINHHLAAGGEARGVFAGSSYLDVGTVGGYRRALELLGAQEEERAHFSGLLTGGRSAGPVDGNFWGGGVPDF